MPDKSIISVTIPVANSLLPDRELEFSFRDDNLRVVETKTPVNVEFTGAVKF